LNDIAHAQAAQRAVKAKFRGHAALKSKVAAHFPETLADEYERMARQYMLLLNAALKENLPTIRRAIDAERAGMRTDADVDASRMIREVMERTEREFQGKALAFGLERKLADLADTTRKHSIREWKRIVHKTLGINILEDYYRGDFYKESMRSWTTNNADLIKSLADKSLTRMENIVQGGYLRGASNKEMARQISEAYGTGKDKAIFIARDQTAKLNAELTKQQQTDAGVDEYIWSTSDDGRVRSCHQEFDGKKFKWSDPPEMWHMTKKNGRVYTGRHCHPGEDYQCRCVALPVFSLPELNLPWTENSATLREFRTTATYPSGETL
jgi:SPP1 gp7 family putative phage head morphogenesis protein